MNNLIYYKYKGKEINTPTNEGYLTDFYRTKDWIEWLQKEFEISQEEWKKKQFDIQFKNNTTQLKYRRLFYTNEEAKKLNWGFRNDGDFTHVIFWPPIYLHPLMEDWMTIIHKCGWKREIDVRKAKEVLKEKARNNDDSCYIISCKSCGERWQVLGKKCFYRVCEDHLDEKTRTFWINAWKKIGVGVIEEKVNWRI
jgi:hypothetical protein